MNRQTRGRRSRRWTALRGDDGLVTSSVVVVVIVGVIALVLVGTLPLLSGTEQSGRTQTSADAAALAGAQSIRERALEELALVTAGVLTGSGGLSGSWTFGGAVGPASGYTAAAQYAQRNGAELPAEWYDYDPFGDTVSVRTRLTETSPNGDHTESEARAQLGVHLAECRLTASRDEVEQPEPTPTPTGPDGEPTPVEPQPEPEPTYTDWEFGFTCPGLRPVTGSTLLGVLAGAADRLDAALTPRLVA